MPSWKVAEELERALEERKAYLAAAGHAPAEQLQWRILNAEIALLMLIVSLEEPKIRAHAADEGDLPGVPP